MLVLIIALVASSGPVDELRTEATRQFRAGDYAAACESFERAAVLAPDDGAIAADLGLCLSRVGRREDAIRWSVRAVILGDTQTRKNAYFNLGLLDAGLRLVRDSKCHLLETVPGCTERVIGCPFGFDDGQPVDNRDGLGVSIRRLADGAAIPENVTKLVVSPSFGHSRDEKTAQPTTRFLASQLGEGEPFSSSSTRRSTSTMFPGSIQTIPVSNETSRPQPGERTTDCHLPRIVRWSQSIRAAIESA